MHRLPHDHLRHLVFHHEGGEAVEIGLVLRPAERLQRAGERARGVRQCEADAHRADVDTQDPPGRPLRRGPSRGHLEVLGPATAEVDLARLVRDRREATAEVQFGRRVVLRLRRGLGGCGGTLPGRRHGRQLAPSSADRAGVLGVVLAVGHVGHLPVAVATACSPACSAAGIPAGSVPPPWATSALPPPRPPTGTAAARSTSLADSPRSRAAGFSAATSATLPPDSDASRTTAGPSASRPRTSRASVRRSPPPRPAGDPVTTATPSTSLAPAASWPAAATDCCARSSASSLSTSRSRDSMPLTRSTSPSCGDFKRSESCRTRSRSRARYRKPSRPTTASTRRAPEPTEDSPVSARVPICALPRTCVPPQSSRDQGPPISTTRTCSP